MVIKNRDELINNRSIIFKKLREDILSSLEYLFEKIDPENRIKEILKKEDGKLKILDDEVNLNEFKRIFLFAFGKGSIKMTKGVISELNVYKGVVIGNVETNDLPQNIEYIKGNHPIPGEGSLLGGKKLIELAKETKENDLSIVLISGGGSSLVEDSLIPLQDLKELTKIMLRYGLSINEINIIRKHLSNIKGGKFLNYLKGKVYSLIISDVIGDKIDTIASGPTYFDNSTFKDAYDILNRYEILKIIPKSVIEIIEKGLRGEIEETLKEKEFPNERVKNYVILSNIIACEYLIEFLKNKGYSVLFLGSKIQGEVKEVSKILGEIIIDIYEGKIDIKKPVALIFGGETTVFVKGDGKGGRNQELTLLMSKFIKDKKILFLSIGTDGIDGITDAAGAICDGETFNRIESLKLNIDEFLDNNDSYNLFLKLNDLIFTGPTGNNVMDIGISLIL
ncbi:MAG TPA: glycerate kinase [Caldisericia bacterium]|nr:glycerate kinase [Caldisericia bacterium]